MPATHYVTLNGPLPAGAGSGEAFPLLRWDGASVHRYALALADDEANDLAEAAMGSLGFERDPNGLAGGGWRLFAVRGGGQGPLLPFDGGAHLGGLPPGAPAGGGADEAVVTVPAGPLTLTADLGAGDHDLTFAPDVFGLKLDPATLAFRLRAPGGGASGLAPGFVLDLVPDQPALDAAQGGPGRGVTLPYGARLSFAQEPGPAGLFTANGRVVRDDGTGREGLPSDEDDDGSGPADPNDPFKTLQLELGGLALRARPRQGSDPVRLEVEVDLDEPGDGDGGGTPRPGVPVGEVAGGLVRFAIGPAGLRARLGPGRAPALALVLLPDNAEEVELELQAEAGLIMGVTSLPDARAYLLPARDAGTSGSLEFPLRIGFVVTVPAWFRGPVVTAKFGPFRLDYSDALKALPGVSLGVAAIDAVKAELGALDAGLSDLLGPATGDGTDTVTFRLETDLPVPEEPFGLGDGPTIAIGMVVTFPKGTGRQRGSLRLSLGVAFDFLNFRVKDNRVYFLFGTDTANDHFVDLGVFALAFPERTEDLDGLPPRQTGPDFHDGWLDLDRRELVVAPTAPAGSAAAGEPGGFLADREGLTAFVPGMLTGRNDPGIGTRFRLTAQSFSPDDWPASPADPRDNILFRVGARGLSVYAKGTQDEVLLKQKEGNELGDVKVQPQAARKGVRSELVVIDSTIRAAELFARMPLPGVTNIVAQATVAIRQPRRGAPPRVVAQLELEDATKAPLADLAVGFLKLQLQSWRLGLEWVTDGRKWSPSLIVDGTLSFSDAVNSVGGLEDLKKDGAIEVRDLDLLNLNRATFDLALKLKRPVEFDLLGGLLLVRLEGLKFTLPQGGPATLSCDRTLFRWKDPGVLEVSIGTGPVAVVFHSPTDVGFRLDSRLSVEVRVKDSFRFQGELEWRDRDGKRFFAAGGTVSVAGLPGVTGFLKLGDETKRSGKRAPSQVVFAGVDVDVEVFTGVTLKSFAGGVGYNNRLAALDDDPNADKMLAKIDTVHPESPDGWAFVDRDGTYFSIVAAVAIGSNRGGPDVVNAYIAQLVVSIGTDGVAAAAGRVWLFSSLNFTRSLANRDRPVLSGAIVFNPKRRALTVALETGPDPAFEVGDSLVAKALSGLEAVLRVRLTPEVADYFLERVQYQTDLLGIGLTVRGSFRVALFDDVMLVKASLDLEGGIHKELSGGPGGFSFSGDIRASVSTAGVASTRGLMSYGDVDFSADFSVSAYIEVEFDYFFGSDTERFDADFGSLHVGLTGQGAFAEDGAFGIRGTATISVSICGFGLEISPGFDYRGEVVDRVRRQVDRYLSRLDQLVNDALGGGGPAPALAPAAMPAVAALAAAAPVPAPAPEVWLLLTNGTARPGPVRFALVPAASGRWLAPQRVPSSGLKWTLTADVRELEVDYQVNGNTSTKRLFTPWVEDVPPQFPAAVAAQTARARLRDLVLSTAGRGQELPARETISSLLIDPRVRSESSAFLEEDARLLTPEGVFSFAFRDLSLLSDIEAGADPLASHPDFEAARKYDQARAAAAVLNRTRRDDRDENERTWAARAAFTALVLDELTRLGKPARLTFDDRNPASDAFGLVFSLPQGAKVTGARVRRDGATSFQTVTLVRPGEASANPSFDPMDKVTLFMPRQQFRVVDDGRESDGRERSTVEVRLPIEITADLVNPDNPLIDSFQVFRRLSREDEPRLIAQGVRPVIERQESGDLRLDPYLYRDVLPVLDREFLVPGLQPGVTLVYYSVRAGRPGESGVPPGFTSNRWKEFPPVRLFVPPPPPFAGQLGVAFPAESLLQDDFQGRVVATGTFLLVDLSKPVPVPARNADGSRMKKADIELWAEELPLRQDGFLIGGEAERETSAEASPEAPRRLRAASMLQSIEGKFLVALKDDHLHGGLVLDDPGRFQPGLGYKFYARLQSTAARPGALLAPLEIMYLTRWPGAGDRLKLRGAEQFEVVAPGTVRPAAFLDRRHFTAATAGAVGDPLDPLNLLHLLRAQWDSLSLLDGGVELVWSDRDDPRLERRQLCEVLEEGLFRTSRADFGKASGWLAVGGGRRLLAAPAPVAGDDAVKVFVPDPAFDPVVKPLVGLTSTLSGLLDGTKKWSDVAPMVAGWSAAFARYLVSPLDLDDSVARVTDTAADEAVRLLVTGWMPSVDASEGLAKSLIKAGEDLREVIRKATAPREAPPAQAAAPGNTSFVMAADSRLSRRLAAILTHRLALADEILGARSLASIRTGATPVEVLPRFDRWKALQAEADAAGGRRLLPRTYALLDAVWPPPPGAPVPVGQLTPFEAMRQMAASARALALTPDERKRALAAIAPEARGLRQVLDALKGDGEELVRRGRHQLQTRRDDVAGAKVAVPTPLESLLPDAWQVPGALAALAEELAAGRTPTPLDPAAADRGAVAFFNVLERLGFAVDVAVVDKMNRFVEQPAFLDRLDPASPMGATVRAAVTPGHTLLAVAGQASFSRYRPEGDRVGYSFAKVAVVPDGFRPGAVAAPHDRRDWFVKRSLTPRDDSLMEACLWVIDQLARRFLVQDAPEVKYVEPVDEQWLTLPSVGGVSESYWRLLEGLGHVVTLKIRQVSRYEPLLTWAGLNPEIVSAAAPAPAVSDQDVTRTVEVMRVFPAPGAPAEGEERALAAVETTAYPHPTLVRFSYQLPSDGARSLLNAISAMRTGFRGTDLGFGYTLPEAPAGDNRARTLVMEAMTPATAGLPAPRPVDPSDLPVREAARPRLFRNERLVTLPDLAYFYEYTLSARAAYLGRRPAVPALSVLSRPEASPSPAERSPRQLAIPRPRLAVATGPPLRVTAEVFLARHADLLTGPEAAAAPPALPFPYHLGTTSQTTPAPDLPDLMTRYTLIYLQAGNVGTPSPEDIYVRVASVTLPWSPFHGKADKPKPVVAAIHDKVTLTQAGGPDVREFLASVEVLPGVPPAYRVTFTLKVLTADTILLADPSRVFLVADRGGPESKRSSFEVLTGGGS